MNIVGLDLSLTATGVCLADGSTATIRTKTADGDARLVQIADAVEGYCRGADLVVVEALLEGRTASARCGMAQGVARLALIREGIAYVDVSPATLKKFATGVGNCDKVRMATAAALRFGLEFKDDNRCDAFWLRAAGLQHYGEPLVKLPALQAKALDVVPWPVLRAVAA